MRNCSRCRPCNPTNSQKYLVEIMSDNQNKPREYDAVKGGQNSIPVNAAVLGGIAGVKRRLASSAIEVRIAALSKTMFTKPFSSLWVLCYHSRCGWTKKQSS
ncbi:MAG: hypothetical protein EAZ88_24890 [Oscillatoriales cyanobacterium]|nr:MAG: hypothetical protein EAZ88_24890 [Oscillatoriales cyanobacterium]